MKLNQLFCDGAVLQANKTVRVFGEGKGTVAVEIDGITASAEFKEENWVLELEPHNYGGPYEMKIVMNGEETVLNDIYFGDVFVLAGQSNLQFKLQVSNTSEEFYETNPKLRLFSTERIEKLGEFFFPEDGWVKAEKENVGKWSAVGYLAGNVYSKSTDHAVGLITCYQGASMIQAWLPKGTLDGTECDIACEARSGHLRRQQYMDWSHDGQLYEFTFLKIAPFAVKTVIWYQGESNTHPPENTTELYKGMLRRLINIWRKDLMEEKLPFVVVQLANYLSGNKEGWPAVQKAQVEIPQEMEEVYSLISGDLCEDNDIHPPTKLPLAQRLAKLLEEIK